MKLLNRFNCSFTLIFIIFLYTSTTTSEASIQCYDCHGTSIPVDYRPLDASIRDEESGGFQGNHRTHIAAPATPANCIVCHPGSSSYTPSHRDGDITLSSRLNNSPLTTRYRNFTTAWRQTSSPTLGSCSNVNCHFETLTPVWGDPPFSTTSQCNKCHAGTINLSATHAVHQRYSTGLMGKFSSYAACASCHINYASPPSFSHATSAGRRPITVSVGNYNSGSLTYLPSQDHGDYGSCTNLYCHSPGNRGAAPFTPPIQTATWEESLRTDCSGCHKGNYASFKKMSSGSHTKHVYLYNRIDCVKCHSKTVDNGLFLKDLSYHVNGTVDISYNNSSTAVNGTYNGSLSPASKTPGTPYGICTNVYCHSNGQNNGGTGITYTQPTWGNSATGRCGQCHEVAASHNFSGNEISSGSHSPHLLYNSMTVSNAVKCTQCHNWNGQPFTPSCTDQCHNSISSKHANHQIDIMIPSHFGPNARYDSAFTPGNGYSTCTSVYCHSNGTSVTTGTVPAAVSPSWGSGAMQCNGCHGNKTFSDFRKALPLYTSNRPTTKANSHLAHGIRELTCNQCHFGVTSDNTSIASKTLHVNGSYSVLKDNSVSFAYTFKTAGSTCAGISCHGNTAATWGSAACLDCHAVAQGKRAAVTGQFASNSHHVQGTITNAHCYQCHWEAHSDGTINQTYHSGAAASGSAVDLVVYGAGSRPASYNSGSFVTYTANGTRSQIQKISSHCLGCHSDQNNSATPFGDGKTPRQYAWDSTSVDARYSQSAKTSWGKYTSAAYPNAAKKKIDKALSAHGNAGTNQRGWNTATGVDGAITNTSGAVAVQCYDCHNSHGSAASGITSRYSSATGRNRGGILKTTQRGFGGYSATYEPQAAGSAANKDVRNPGASLCLDCHFSSTPTQAPLAAFKGYTTPWGYNSTFSATQGILGYWDSPYMSYGMNVGVKQRYPFKAQNLTMGGHFGASSPLNVQVSPGNQINGLCTPCHDPHGVTPTLGANQKHAVPLLKGTWLTSPYQEDTSPANNGDMFASAGSNLPYRIDQNTFGTGIGAVVTVPALNDVGSSGGLCIGCHSKNSLTTVTSPASPNPWKSKDRIHETVKGWKSSSAIVKHGFTCSKCHSAHTSSVLPRLMVTNCLDGVHKGRSSLNINPMISNAVNGDEGSGSGRFPGVYSGSGICEYPGGPACNASFSTNCHEGNTGSGTNQGWNTVTPWGVATPPPAPALNAQTDSTSSGGNRNINLTWGTVSCPSGAAPQYRAEISGTSDFAAIEYQSGWIAATTWTQPLPLGTWYWRVTARDSVVPTAQSVPSATDTFVISYAAPVAPTLTAQTNSNSSGGAISKSFNWNGVAPTDVDPVEYRVEVSTSAANFSTISYDSGWIASTSWTQSIPVGAWKWRVAARDSVHTTAVSIPSTSGSFSIIYTLPAAPALTAQPATSYTSGTDKSLSFNWNPVTASDGDSCEYLAEVSNNASFSPVSYTSGWQSGTGWAQLLPTGSWYWRVKSRDSVHSTAVSTPSPSGSFGIEYAAPAAPTLIAQPNHSSAANVNVNFQWNAVTPTDADPMEYFAEVSSSADFGTIAHQSAWQSATSWTQSVAPGTWYWRVKSRDSVHTTAVSNPSGFNSFTISTDPLPPIAPVLISQTGGNVACTSAYTHNLQWNAVTAPDGDAVEYYLQLDTVSSFDSANLQQSGWIATTSWTTPAPITTGTWYWRVKARDAVHTAMESSYSTISSFSDTNTWTCDCDGSCPGSSCPLVYSFNGSQFIYESDLAGPVISQYPKGSGAVSIYQPVYMTLGQLVPDANNQYQVKIWESLNEGVFLDETKLLAVDYPVGYEIASSGGELTYYNAYVNPFHIYTLKNPVPPVSATDKNGTDVRASLLAVDDIPAPMTPNTPDNHYILDFGTIQHPEHAKLVIDGWMIINSKLYSYPTFIKPYIEVMDTNGAWVNVKTLGMPAGDLKTMVVDLSNIFLSSDHRIRLNLGVRKTTIWVIDRIRLDDSAPVNVSTQELSPFSTKLQFGGQAITEMSTPQHRIHVGTDLPIKPNFFGYGSFTRYGKVKDLLALRDDKYVIMNYGDMLDLKFPALPAPQTGMTRAFLIKADLWYKEFKDYKYLDPLPFHGMSNYPPPSPEAYPTDPDHNQYRQDYNTRILEP